jgi:hypothetical protein
MIYKNTLKAFRCILVLLLFAAVSANGQYSNPELENQVRQFLSQGDYDSLVKLLTLVEYGDNRFFASGSEIEGFPVSCSVTLLREGQ